MKLLPRLIKSKMFLAFGDVVRDKSGKGMFQHDLGRTDVDVEEWEGVGLCIHKYHDAIVNIWRVSHVQSGRSILRHIRTREEAIYYMMMLHDIEVNWNIAEDQYHQLPNHEGIHQRVLVIQREISGELR